MESQLLVPMSDIVLYSLIDDQERKGMLSFIALLESSEVFVIE